MNPMVTYVVSKKLIESVDKISSVRKRASVVHSLLSAMDILKEMKIVSYEKASEEDMRMFHSEEYLEYLKKVDSDTIQNSDDEIDDDFGLGFDCPYIDGIYDIASEIAGASLRAANALINNESKFAINWAGGWHHAQRDSASGFCYVNDIVLAIQRLRKKFDKILYVDLDVHHGDGVENAFAFSPKIFTLSLHQYEAGFFPGTGSLTEVGQAKGKYFSMNVPYKAGLNDQQLHYMLQKCLNEIQHYFSPDAIVCQSGADALAGDPLGVANISLNGYVRCIELVKGLNVPTLFLGGGGYNITNTAKLWAAITLNLLNKSIPDEIPEHVFFPLYGPDFVMDVRPTLRKTENSENFLNEILEEILSNLKNVKKPS